MGPDIAGGGSRKPLVFLHVSAGLALRRISLGWRDTIQSGSPPGVGNKHALATYHLFEHEHEHDEDDGEPYWWVAGRPSARRARTRSGTGGCVNRRPTSSG